MLIILLISIMFVVLGVLIKHFKWYWLIAGYNTASQKEKEKYDIEALGNFMGNMLYLIAGVMFLGVLLRYLGFRLVGDLSWLGLIGIVIYMVFKGQKFNREDSPKLRKSTVGILLIIFIPAIAFTVIPITYGIFPSQVVMGEDTIKITRMYGTAISKEDITSIELIDEIPKIKKKTNGFDFGNIQKGNFQLEEWGRGKLYLESKRGPYILIRYNKEDFILINYKKPNEEQRVFEMITE